MVWPSVGSLAVMPRLRRSRDAWRRIEQGWDPRDKQTALGTDSLRPSANAADLTWDAFSRDRSMFARASWGVGSADAYASSVDDGI